MPSKTKRPWVREQMLRRWAEGDPSLRSPNAAIIWTQSLQAALKALVETVPPIGWDEISSKLGISVEPCKRQAAAMGLRKANSNPRWRVNMGLPPVSEASTLPEARAMANQPGKPTGRPDGKPWQSRQNQPPGR